MNSKILTIITIIVINFLVENDAARILAIFPFQSRSHQMMFDAIMKGALRKGHKIDVFTVYPFKDPPENYTVLGDLSKHGKSLVNQWNVKYAAELGEDTLPLLALPYGNGLCEYLALPEFQKLIKNPPKDPPYDLLLLEGFASHCYIGIAHIFKIPTILISSTVAFPWLESALGQPDYPAFIPSFFTNYAHPMSFPIRVMNTIKTHLDHIRFDYWTNSVQNNQMKKYIDPNIPTLHELEKNVVVALVNSWPSLTGVRPVIPGIVSVGGIHVKENYRPLPEKLEKWLNDSTSGLIYFTLGSMVNIETFPEETMRAFYSVFTRIAPVRVLMKVANKSALLPGLPDNVITSSWIPQVAVLAHKNTKIFITHGGLMSSQESLTFGVPMIGIPMFGDQDANIQNYMRIGMALKLNIKNLNFEDISYAVNEMLNNPKWSEQAKYQAQKFLDRPLSAMDTAMYWIDYAMRHGPAALQSPVVDMPWWQVALLDVYGFLIICAVILFYLILRIGKVIYSIISANGTLKRQKLD